MAGTMLRGSTAQYNPAGMEVPFTVNNKEKWISGIVEETTCGDVVKALLAAEGRLKGINEEQLDKFVMVERWRKVRELGAQEVIIITSIFRLRGRCDEIPAS